MSPIGRSIPLVPEDTGFGASLAGRKARRKPQRYLMVSRGFATPQCALPDRSKAGIFRYEGYIRVGSNTVLRQRGFSLIELIVVISIAAILLALGVPSFRSLLQNQKMTSTVNDFFSAINLTRSEAIQRGGRVDLVPTDVNDWRKGWIIFVDENNNQRPDPGERIVFSHGPAPDGIQITATLTDSKVKYLAYNGTGRTRVNASNQTPQAGNFLFTMGDSQRKIVLNFLGRPRICNPVTESTC